MFVQFVRVFHIVKYNYVRKGEGEERGRRVLAGMSEEEEKGGRGREREACAGWDE